MIEFVTLLLGLTMGVRPVELAVDGRVAAVEIRLDGRVVQRLTQPPWTVAVDFGSDLRPHILEAVALDADQNPLETARQTVNYGRSNYEAVLVLDEQEETQERTGRIVWSAIRDRAPRQMELLFDGKPVPVGRRGSFRLPVHDLAENHFLEAQLVFANGKATRASLSFGGIYGDRVTSALTAVPVLVPEEQTLPPVAEMKGWLAARGEPLRPFSTETEDDVVVIVRDRNLSKHLRALPKPVRRQLDKLGRFEAPWPTIVFASTAPDVGAGGTFKSSRAEPPEVKSGLWDLMTMHYPEDPRRREQQLWDSLAVAGSLAGKSDRPRAVVMLLGDTHKDASALTPALSRDFLRSIRVPFFGWAPESRELPALASSSPDGLYVGANGMLELFEDLFSSLESQRIVWVEGLHLPRQIALTELAPSGLQLVH